MILCHCTGLLYLKFKTKCIFKCCSNLEIRILDVIFIFLFLFYYFLFVSFYRTWFFSQQINMHTDRINRLVFVAKIYFFDFFSESMINTKYYIFFFYLSTAYSFLKVNTVKVVTERLLLMKKA